MYIQYCVIFNISYVLFFIKKINKIKHNIIIINYIKFIILFHKQYIKVMIPVK